ncbi:Substance-P receptor [Toxocara canis]|uniref:Substance-P receptor n=1 Tax=Toxocara canis TaxID=6265 RepID=A0A0B2V033_TOXCA|nr:Substance-P receptor [Toxocara canis]
MDSAVLFACSNISGEGTHIGGSCHVLNLSSSQPPWLARPIYGLAAPIIILVTLITNSLVIVVLSHRNLRTPTNHILLAMAIAELMTGLSSCPWFIYYYTLGGFLIDQHEGLNPFWCRFHSYFAVHFPTIFHTTAIWLTVFLAIQRYVYVCVPSMVCKYCNPARTRQMIVVIALAALMNEMPIMLFESSVSVQLSQQSRLCIRLYAPFIEKACYQRFLDKVNMRVIPQSFCPSEISQKKTLLKFYLLLLLSSCVHTFSYNL